MVVSTRCIGSTRRLATARLLASSGPGLHLSETTVSSAVRVAGGRETSMIDHTGVTVSDFNRSKAFYRAALAPIGYSLLAEFPAEVTGGSAVAGFGEPPKPDFWINGGTPN